MTDIVVTWPKSRPLQSYLGELERASERGAYIYFKLGSMPLRASGRDRCYMVHSGHVRGWTTIMDLQFLPQEGPLPIDPVSGVRMGEGAYVIRSPQWHELKNVTKMKGFQGFRYAPKWWRQIGSVSYW